MPEKAPAAGGHAFMHGADQVGLVYLPMPVVDIGCDVVE